MGNSFLVTLNFTLELEHTLTKVQFAHCRNMKSVVWISNPNNLIEILQ